MKSILSIVLFLFLAAKASAQTEVSGSIVNSQGKAIEYVSVGIENDSVGVIADKNGVFKIKVPNRNSRLTFSHVAYNNLTIPVSTLLSGGNGRVVMKEKDVVLPDVGIVYGKKIKTISGKGMRIPGTAKVSGETNCIWEFGTITNAGRNYSVEKITIPVKECTYTTCKLNLRFYDVTDGGLQSVQNKPIYISLKRCGKTQITMSPDEKIIFRKNHRYFVCLYVVDLTGKGHVTFPAYVKSGFFRNSVSGKRRKLPASLGIDIKGYEIKM